LSQQKQEDVPEEEEEEAGKTLKIGDVLVEGFEEDTSDWEEIQENERDDRMREDFRIGGKKKRKVYEDSNGLSTAQGGGPSPVFADYPLPNPYTLPLAFDQDPLSSTLLPFPPPHDSFDPDINPFSLPEPPLSTTQFNSTSSSSSQYIDLLTGSNYHHDSSTSHHTQSRLSRKYKCPFPSILALPFHPTLPSSNNASTGSGSEGQEEEEEDGEGICAYWFKRIYDLERHLKSRHGVEMVGGKETLRIWFEAGTGGEV